MFCWHIPILQSVSMPRWMSQVIMESVVLQTAPVCLLFDTFEFNRFGSPITTMPYFEHVLEADEASRRAAVKLLTRTIEARLVKLTINAPDWSVNP